jgi:hypothetical protein
VQLSREKLEMQISQNLDDNVNTLIDIKHKLEVETNPEIIKVLIIIKDLMLLTLLSGKNTSINQNFDYCKKWDLELLKY